MSQKIDLVYQVKIDENKRYSLKIRIGDAHDGDHNVFGTCPYKSEPINDNPEWETYLGLGNEIKGKMLFITSSCLNSNPNTNIVSSRVFINDKKIEPIKGEISLSIEEKEIAFFNQKIDFV